jgi:hypothetical protein
MVLTSAHGLTWKPVLACGTEALCTTVHEDTYGRLGCVLFSLRTQWHPGGSRNDQQVLTVSQELALRCLAPPHGYLSDLT